MVEALKLAQADAERGQLNDELILRVRDAVAEIVDDLATHIDTLEPESDNDAHAGLAKVEETFQPTSSELPDTWLTGTPVLCIPGVGLLDEAVALMMAQLLQRIGIDSRAEPADALSMSRIVNLKTKNVALICLCYVEKATPAQIRYATRRLRRYAPDAHILVSLVGNTRKGEEQVELLDGGRISLVAGTLRETIEGIRAVAIASEKSSGSPNALATAASG